GPAGGDVLRRPLLHGRGGPGPRPARAAGAGGGRGRAGGGGLPAGAVPAAHPRPPGLHHAAPRRAPPRRGVPPPAQPEVGPRGAAPRRPGRTMRVPWKPARPPAPACAAAVVLPLLAAAVWLRTPPLPRATLPGGSVVVGVAPAGRLLAPPREARGSSGGVGGGRRAGELPGELADLREVTFSPDGRRLAARCGALLKLWEVPAGRQEAALDVGADTTTSCGPAFSPDGRWLTFRAGGRDRTRPPGVWDVGRGREGAWGGGGGGRGFPGGRGPACSPPAGSRWPSRAGRPGPACLPSAGSACGTPGRARRSRRSWRATSGRCACWPSHPTAAPWPPAS